jgi:hypothetical protein
MKESLRLVVPILVACLNFHQSGFSQQTAGQGSAPGTPRTAGGSSIPRVADPGFVPGTNGTALGQPSTVLGQPSPSLGQPSPVLGQPSTVLGAPNTAIGQPNNAIGQPNTGIVPSGTTNAVIPSGSTTALAPLTNSFGQRGTASSIGQVQPGTGLAIAPVTNGFIVNPDGTVIALPQGGASGLGGTNTGTGGVFPTNNLPNP